jgi:hypothetical protein
VVTFVRRSTWDFSDWDSFGDFLGYWVLHAMALGLFTIFTVAVIMSRYKFFLGHERSDTLNEFEEPIYYVLATVFFSAIAVFVLKNH